MKHKNYTIDIYVEYQILNMLSSKKWVRLPDIYNNTGIPPGTVQVKIKKWRELGLVEVVKRWGVNYVKLTEKGETYKFHLEKIYEILSEIERKDQEKNI